MLITIRVPDETTQILYTTTDRNGQESRTKKATIGMIVKLEKEDETSRGG